MLQLCREGRVVPIYGHVFIEETLTAYGNEGKRDALVNRWLPFITATSSHFCNDFNTIWHEELVQGRGPNARLYMPHWQYETLVHRFPDIPLDGSWRAWHASKAQRDVEGGKRDAQKKLAGEVRREIADWRKAVRYHPKRHGGGVTLEAFFEREIDYVGREFIPRIIPAKNPRAIANRWSRSKLYYPFFTAFVVEILYLMHHAMLKVNSAIDLNAQADLNFNDTSAP